MIIWTPLPVEQIMAGFDKNDYPDYQTGEVSGVPVLLEQLGDGRKRVVRVNSSDPAHYLQDVYPGLIT